MKIEPSRLKNFKAPEYVQLCEMPAVLATVGANGVSKTTLFDIFGFLHDCHKTKERQALGSCGPCKAALRHSSGSNRTVLIKKFHIGCRSKGVIVC